MEPVGIFIFILFTLLLLVAIFAPKIERHHQKDR